MTEKIPGDTNGDGKVSFQETIAAALASSNNVSNTVNPGSRSSSSDSGRSLQITPRETADSQLDQTMIQLFGSRATRSEKATWFKFLNAKEKAYASTSSSSSSSRTTPGKTNKQVDKTVSSGSSTSTGYAFNPQDALWEYTSQLAASRLKQGKALGGKAAEAYDNLSSYAANMGIAYDPAAALKDTIAVIKGSKDTTSINNEHRTRAIALHAGLGERLLADPSLTVRAASADYIQSMSAMLDIPAASISLNDSTLQKAINATDKNGKGKALSLNEFQQNLRQDHRFGYSTMAHNEARDMAASFASAFGFGG